MGQRVAIYCRVSTDDQSCERQERDLRALAERAGHEVVGVYMEKASGACNDRQERKKVIAMAQARQIDAVLVTEISRWGRSTKDLLETLDEGGVESQLFKIVAKFSNVVLHGIESADRQTVLALTGEIRLHLHAQRDLRFVKAVIDGMR